MLAMQQAKNEAWQEIIIAPDDGGAAFRRSTADCACGAGLRQAIGIVSRRGRAARRVAARFRQCRLPGALPSGVCADWSLRSRSARCERMDATELHVRVLGPPSVAAARFLPSALSLADGA